MRRNMKLVALLVCAAFLISPFSAMTTVSETGGSRAVTIPKIVVGELFTGLWCGYCKYAEQAMDNLVKDKSMFDGRFVVVEWHNGDTYAAPEGPAREAYYSVSGFPTARFDGKDSVVGAASTAAVEANYRTKINNRPKNSDVYLEIDAHLVGTSLTVWVNATLMADTALTNLKLHAVLIEDENISVGQYPIRMTARNHTINAEPVSISQKDDVASVTKTVTINGAWEVADLAIVAFLQSDTTKEVLQAGINYLTANGAPTKTGEIADATIDEDSTFTKDLKTVYTDPENDPVGDYVFTSTVVNGSIDANSKLTITPPPEWSGQDTVYLVISDGMNFPMDYTFKITVNPVNDEPIKLLDIPDQSLLEGQTKTDVINLVTYFKDVEDTTLAYSVTGQTNVVVTIKTSGLVTLGAPFGWSGGKETLTFTATDTGGKSISDTIDVTVKDVNLKPKMDKAIADITMDEDKVDTTIDLDTHFSDPDGDTLQYTIAGNTNINITKGTDNVLTIAPTANWNGQETVTVTVTDTINPAISDQFIIVVNPINDVPELTGTTFESPQLNEDQKYTTEMKASALFKDQDGDPLAITLEGGNNDLTITLESDTTVSFEPVPNWFGEMDYTLKASDGRASVEYTAHVKFLPVNDPVMIDSSIPLNPAMDIKENDKVDFSIVASDIDEDTITYTWTINEKPAGDGTGSYKFETDYNSSGTYNIKVVVSDGQTTASKAWTIKVKDVNRKPTVTIVSPNATDVLKSNVPITFVADGSDPDGDQLIYQWSIDGMSVNSGKSITSQVLGGAHTVKVIASDPKGGSAEATMSITVKKVSKKTGTSGVAGGALLYAAIVAIVIVVIIVALVAMKMRGKKAQPAPDQTAQVAPLPPPPEQTAPAYDPNAGYYQQQQTYDPNAGYYPPPPQQ